MLVLYHIFHLTSRQINPKFGVNANSTVSVAVSGLNTWNNVNFAAVTTPAYCAVPGDITEMTVAQRVSLDFQRGDKISTRGWRGRQLVGFTFINHSLYKVSLFMKQLSNPRLRPRHTTCAFLCEYEVKDGCH